MNVLPTRREFSIEAPVDKQTILTWLTLTGFRVYLPEVRKKIIEWVVSVGKSATFRNHGYKSRQLKSDNLGS